MLKHRSSHHSGTCVDIGFEISLAKDLGRAGLLQEDQIFLAMRFNDIFCCESLCVYA